jgi:hypothetical protein
MGWDGMGWDGMGWDGLGWAGLGCDDMDMVDMVDMGRAVNPAWHALLGGRIGVAWAEQPPARGDEMW